MDSKLTDVSFGFNDIDLSNRVLCLEIIPALAGTSLKVNKFHINSLILASKSRYFYKLFKNGMRESQQGRKDVTLRISESEEASFMDLLKFMYGNPMSGKSESELVDVLMAADKFEVTTCMTHCIELLLKLPMTTKSALFYVELASLVFVGEVTRPIVDAANQHLCALISGFTKCQKKAAMSLPLYAVEAALGSDHLRVNSEEIVLDFIFKWARLHYPKLEDRRDILTNRLLRFVCFECMSSSELKKVLDSPDFEYEQVSKLVLNALLFKDVVLPNCRFPRRIYNHRIVIPFDIKKEQCADMLPDSSLIQSDDICLGERCFKLGAKRASRLDSSVEHFALFLKVKGSESCSLGFEFAVMKKPSNHFQRLFMVNNRTFTSARGNRWGTLDLFGMPWTDLMKDDSDFMIDGVIHIRAQLAINN